MSNAIMNKVDFGTKLSFGLGGFGKDFGLNVINVFLFFYYTDVVGVSAAFVGTVFLVARIWDTVNDPMLGYIVAKTKSKWGRYKPWILVGNILNAITIIALFSAHMLDGTSQLVYIAATYVLWGMTYTMLDAPFWSLVPTITLDKKEREGLMPYPRLFATGASYLAGGAGVYIVSTLGGGDDGQGYFWFGVIAAILAVASAVITCIWTKQNFEEDPKSAAMFNLKAAKDAIFKNEQFLALVVLSLFYNVAFNFMNGLNLYYFTYVLGDATLFAKSMLFGGIVGVGSLVIFKPVVMRFGRKTLFNIALICPMLAVSTLYVASGCGPELKAALASVAGIFNGLSSAMFWLILLIMVADTVDYGDAKNDVRSESVLYSVNTLVSKCSGALTGFLVGLALTAINYIPNQDQTAETLSGLQFIFVGPAFLCLVSMFIYNKLYKLNGNELDSVQDSLKLKYS
ncbi:melibiose:sodium transporter MelB [Photobacterium sp. ZSDE20]|uniref:Melibiose:sodium transporter MelB n=1 Tax=Photobacterium pectinilyticum TaxID=2906793 RepID=A0ABT1N4R1_9GAMM|nr:melibiose:sodium transporter MelB [Photobacterium sp. ZSDE20]MCQ1059722.1 melibiose:sodium transporter MelB [Photobacterium sp. ZSDE20]MDD1825928.1 melibiose:sodium transporter MelB [Photobacterium sp. ZSDE20]